MIDLKMKRTLIDTIIERNRGNDPKNR